MRVGMVIRVRPEKLSEYRELHDRIWPDVVKLLRQARLAHFSIFHKDEFLFGYFEYHGDDVGADLARISEQPIMKDWLALTMACQAPLATRHKGEWWARMDEIFHMP